LEKDRNEVHTLKCDRVMMEAGVYAHESNWFGPGKPRYVKGEPFIKRQYNDPEEYEEASEWDGEDTVVKDLSGKKVINVDSMFPQTNGNERAKRYFEKNGKQQDVNDPHRSETEAQGGVSLAIIPPFQSDTDKKGK
jgi:hypothetical protein